MKECESATVSAVYDLSLESDDTSDNMKGDDENGTVRAYDETDADKLNMTSSSDDLVTSASDQAAASTRAIEEPLYGGSKISKVLLFVLIVSFVLKHSLSKAAWADLLNILTVLLGDRCKKTFQSVYKMKLMNEGVVSKETVVLRRWGSSIQKFGFINGVDNVNWPPYRDSKS